MTAVVSMMSVVTGMTVCATVAMIAVMAVATGTDPSGAGAVKNQDLPCHLKSVGPQHASVANACTSHFQCVADVGQEPLVSQNLCLTQADFGSGVSVLQPDMEVVIGQERCFSDSPFQCHRIAWFLTPKERYEHENEDEQRVSLMSHDYLPQTDFAELSLSAE